MTFDEQYREALQSLQDDGLTIKARGMECKEILSHGFVIDPKDRIISLPGFETNVDYAEEELRWYMSGSDRFDFSPIIEKTWKKFSDDGESINSAYGYRIFKKWGNQWEWIVAELQRDPDSRRCVFNINEAYDKKKGSKDIPCTIAMQVFLREGALHWITVMRSQDIVLGTRNDVYCFTKMQEKLSEQLGARPGIYFHRSHSLHIYQRHYEKMARLLASSKGA